MIGIKDFKMPKGCGDCACYDVEWARCVFVNKSAEDFDKRLVECPLVEAVEPVIHGLWKDDGEVLICSNCKGISDAYNDCYDEYFEFNGIKGWARRYPAYCKRCGARMDDISEREVD